MRSKVAELSGRYLMVGPCPLKLARASSAKLLITRKILSIDGGDWTGLRTTSLSMRKKKAATLRVSFGRRLRELRREQGLSLESLGEKAGVDDKYIQSVETARQAASLDIVEKLAAGLGVLPRDLFAFSDELPADTRERIERLLGVVSDADLKRIARVIEALIGV